MVVEVEEAALLSLEGLQIICVWWPGPVVGINSVENGDYNRFLGESIQLYSPTIFLACQRTGDL